jgi:alkylation response protein AidB-like acyl-CoA dehydrogenase
MAGMSWISTCFRQWAPNWRGAAAHPPGSAILPWCINGCFGGFSDQAQDDMWSDTPTGNPDAIALGTYAAAAEAVPVAGGFRISGKWPFASGCDHGDWALLGARFPATADGAKPVPGLVLVPRDDYEIIDDWHGVGLAASGSKTIACDDLFVPVHRHVLFPDLAGGRGPGRAVNTGAIFGVHLLAVLPATIAAPALGILAAAIGDFTERTHVRETRGAVPGGGHSMAGFANVQSKLAEAAVALDAATLLLQRDISEPLAIAKSGGDFSVDHRIRNRLSYGYALKLAVDAISRCDQWALWGRRRGRAILHRKAAARLARHQRHCPSYRP